MSSIVEAFRKGVQGQRLYVGRNVVAAVDDLMRGSEPRREAFGAELRRINAIKAAMPPQPTVGRMVIAQLPVALHRYFELVLEADPYFLRCEALFYATFRANTAERPKLLHKAWLQRAPWRHRIIACKLSDNDIAHLCVVLPVQ